MREMEVTFVSSDENLDIHLVNADTKSLPCMLCKPTNSERFANMRNLLGHFTNEHSAIHLYGCHLCNQSMPSYTDFIMHKCFEDKDEEFVLNEPRFSYCHALLICSDCGIQFNLNGGVVNETATREYLSLIAVHNSSSMTLACIYTIGPMKKDHFYVNYNDEMVESDFLCKPDLSKCCPALFPNHYNSLVIANFARTTQQSECLELINVKPKIASVSIDDTLSEVMRTEKAICITTFNSNIEKMVNSNFFKTLPTVDENNVVIEDNKCIRLYVSSYETCIPNDILKGFLFDKDVYECSGCREFYDKLDLLEEHYKICQTKKQLPKKFDLFDAQCARMVFNSSLHPSSRILCGNCTDLSFCSFVGLRLHYAQEHSIFVNDNHVEISNKQGINDYGWKTVSNGINASLKRISKSMSIDSQFDANKPIEQQAKKRGRRPQNGITDGFSLAPKILKRASFTRFLHRRPIGSNALEEVFNSRSVTPSSSTSEIRNRRDLRSTSRSKRTYVSRSPTVVDEHNSSISSIENSSNRLRPVSERAKKMEQKKLERERREVEDAEKEEQERDRRRRRAKQAEIDQFESIRNEENLKRPRKVQENLEVVTLSDDDMDSRDASESPHSHPTTGENYCLFCFFCGQHIFDATEFIQHLGRHNEHLQRCPLCIVNESKDHQLKHILHVIDHIVESHIRTDENHCVCPTCDKDFGLIQDIQPLYMCFQHVLFSCEKSKYCMLCLSKNDCAPQKLRQKFWSHCNESHSVVYNRFICSKCMSGFPSKFALLDHTCSYTHRCVCNIGRPFINKQMFLEHVQDADDGNEHLAIKQMSDEIGIYLPSSRRKELRKMELEGLNQRQIKHPTRDECILFFQKYPHLYRPFDSLLSSNVKSLRIIQDLPIENQPKALPIESNRVRIVPSISKPINNEEMRSLLTKKLENHRNGDVEKPIKRRKRKHLNAEGRIEQPKKFKFIKDPPVARSAVWKSVEKYGEEYKEVADVLEDLVLSVSDLSTVFANGLNKLDKPKKPQQLYNIPQPKQIQKVVPQTVNLPPYSNITIEDEDSDEEIEIIGEVKGMVNNNNPSPITQQQQQPPRRILIYRQAPNRVVSVHPSSQYYVPPQRSFMPNLYPRQNQIMPNEEDEHWINQPYTR